MKITGALSAILLALPLTAGAQSAHLCTGIGLDGREEAAAFPHSLKLVYAAPQGSYLGDVTIRVTRSGEMIFEGTCDGPWMLLNVDPGTYEVQSTFDGTTKTQSVRVGRNTVERTIIFKTSD